MTWSTASYVKLLKRAHEEGLVPGIVHSHPRGPARFSRQDDSNEKDLLQLARNRNGDDATLVSILLTGDSGIRARWWPDRHGAVDTVSVRVVGKRLATHTPVPETSSPRVSRTSGTRLRPVPQRSAESDAHRYRGLWRNRKRDRHAARPYRRRSARVVR